MRRVRRVLLVTLAAAAGVYALLIGGLWAAQRTLIYPAPQPAEPKLAGATVVRLVLKSGGETVLLHVKAPHGGRTLVYFHGNGEQLADGAELAASLREEGVGFLGVEYPGYGVANGAPTEAGIYEASEAALRWLHAEGVRREDVVLFGRSIGSGPATEMAKRGHGARLLLVTPFTSLPDVAQRLFPFAPVKFLIRDRFDSLGKAPGVALPVLIIHGTKDEVVPYPLGEQLSRAFPNAKLLPVEGARHNDILGHRGVVDQLLRFIRG